MIGQTISITFRDRNDRDVLVIDPPMRVIYNSLYYRYSSAALQLNTHAFQGTFPNIPPKYIPKNRYQLEDIKFIKRGIVFAKE